MPQGVAAGSRCFGVRKIARHRRLRREVHESSQRYCRTVVNLKPWRVDGEGRDERWAGNGFSLTEIPATRFTQPAPWQVLLTSLQALCSFSALLIFCPGRKCFFATGDSPFYRQGRPANSGVHKPSLTFSSRHDRKWRDSFCIRAVDLMFDSSISFSHALPKPQCASCSSAFSPNKLGDSALLRRGLS